MLAFFSRTLIKLFIFQPIHEFHRLVRICEKKKLRTNGLEIIIENFQKHEEIGMFIMIIIVLSSRWTIT